MRTKSNALCCLVFALGLGCGGGGGAGLAPETRFLFAAEVAGVWAETELTITSNTCGDYPFEAIEQGHPYYALERVDDATVNVFECGKTPACESKHRLLGPATLQGGSLRVVLEKPWVFHDETLDCAEQDIIGVELDLAAGSEKRTLTNKLAGSECAALIAAMGEGILGGCAVEMTYRLQRVLPLTPDF